jgi:hypothetical protein
VGGQVGQGDLTGGTGRGWPDGGARWGGLDGGAGEVAGGGIGEGELIVFGQVGKEEGGEDLGYGADLEDGLRVGGSEPAQGHLLIVDHRPGQ